MSHKTLSIGGAVYDLFVGLGGDFVSQDSICLPLGNKILVDESIGFIGGGASNTSVGLSRLGCSAAYCGIVADDQWGEYLIKQLQQEGVDTSCATVVEGEHTSFSVILRSSGGERVILNAPGASVHLHDATFKKDYLTQVDWVYFNHIQKGSCVIEDDVVDVLTSINTTGLTWNPGGCQIDAGLEAKNNAELAARTTLMQLNEDEALRFTKKDTVDQALQCLVDIGTKHVCITRGKDGIIASDSEKTYTCSSIPAEVVDTTGAGDAFGTGVTWGLIEGLAFEKCLKAGALNAAGVVSHCGAQTGLLARGDMESKLETIDYSVSIS